MNPFDADKSFPLGGHAADASQEVVNSLIGLIGREIEMPKDFIADKGDNGKWGVIDGHNAIAYEYDFDTAEEANFVAAYHNKYPEAEYECDVFPAWCDHIAKTNPSEAARIVIETMPEDALINLIIEHRKLKELCLRSALELRQLTGYGMKGWGVQEFPLVDELEAATK